LQTMLVSLIAAATAAERSTHDVLYAAIIAASAAIVGGVIGGAIPGFFMLKAEDKRHANARELADQARQDETERERRAVIGAARAWFEFFERVDSLFELALKTQQWWLDELDETLRPLSPNDEKAVLGQLSSDEAASVTGTMRIIEDLRIIRAIRRSASPNSQTLPLEERERGDVEDSRSILKWAARSLRRVAELPEPPPKS
jgi:hypothetical protein